MERFNACSLFSPSWNNVVCKICLKKQSLALFFVFLLPWIWHHFCQPLLSHEQKEHFLFSHRGQGMSQSFQETQCSLYAARENSKRGLPMVWEMAGSHRAHKAHSTAWPDSVPTKLVAYFLISKKGKGGREGSKEKSPISLPLNPCWGNHWSNGCQQGLHAVLDNRRGSANGGSRSCCSSPHSSHGAPVKCLLYAWGKTEFSKIKIYLIQKGSRTQLWSN